MVVRRRIRAAFLTTSSKGPNACMATRNASQLERTTAAHGSATHPEGSAAALPEIPGLISTRVSYTVSLDLTIDGIFQVLFRDL